MFHSGYGGAGFQNAKTPTAGWQWGLESLVSSTPIRRPAKQQAV